MNKILILLLVGLFVIAQIVLVYFVPVGWILIMDLALMALFLFIKLKPIALAVVISIFFFGGVLYFLQNHEFTSTKFKRIKDMVYDKVHHKVFKLETSNLKKVAQEEANAKRKYIACQYTTLFGKPTQERFCFYIVGSKLYKLKELQ